MSSSLSTRLSAAALVVALGAASATPARAQQPTSRGTSALAVTAENRTAAAEEARGARRPDAGLRAGDVLRYHLTFTNTAGTPVRKVAIQNPVAAGLQFVPGSARASRDDARAEYTVDGGRTWSARPMERVLVDGRPTERAIPPERYTAVRWVVEGWVAPGTAVTSEFEARLAPRAAAPAAAPGLR